eukprot:3839006-Pyramimonas_sp.AAC.1
MPWPGLLLPLLPAVLLLNAGSAAARHARPRRAPRLDHARRPAADRCQLQLAALLQQSGRAAPALLNSTTDVPTKLTDNTAEMVRTRSLVVTGSNQPAQAMPCFLPLGP